MIGDIGEGQRGVFIYICYILFVSVPYAIIIYNFANVSLFCYQMRGFCSLFSLSSINISLLRSVKSSQMMRLSALFPDSCEKCTSKSPISSCAKVVNFRKSPKHFCKRMPFVRNICFPQKKGFTRKCYLSMK